MPCAQQGVFFYAACRKSNGRKGVPAVWRDYKKIIAVSFYGLTV